MLEFVEDRSECAGCRAELLTAIIGTSLKSNLDRTNVREVGSIQFRTWSAKYL